MEWYWAALLLIGGICLLMALGIPVAFAFFIVNIVGIAALQGRTEAGIEQMLRNGISSITSFTLAPVPLFLIMGTLFFRSGLAKRVLDAIDLCFGRLPGRLSYVTVTAGVIFAALSGSSMANTGMMGTLMVPEMLKRGYKRHMALGPVLGAGGLAVIIPPSGLAVLLGSLARIDIGALLLAGVLPGVVLGILYLALIWLQTRIDPAAAPHYEVPPTSLWQRIVVVGVNILPMGFIVFFVVGFMILGIATPTESAAFGCLATFILALVYRALSWDAVRSALLDAFRVSAMSFILIMASSTFSQLLAFSGVSTGMVTWATGYALAPAAMLIVMILVLLVLGCFMDQLSMMLLTLPIFVPLALQLHFDMILWGVIILLALEIGFTTPPFGLLLFVMMGVVPGTTLWQVSKAALPYIACHFILITMMILYPPLATWLPKAMQ
ncbi:MAG TPA: TRAP transporter large permease [Alphaproteobacteria bacterium]|jgi:tripartite ATP-independent transporter DctM subunit